MPASTIQLRAFELGAGPKTARLVTVNVERTIADIYAHLCGVLKLDAPLSHVTFHTTHDKKVDTAPLSTTVPIGSLGLAHNGIFIVRQSSRTRPTAAAPESSAGAATPASENAKTASSAAEAGPTPTPHRQPPPSTGAASSAVPLTSTGDTASSAPHSTESAEAAAAPPGSDKAEDALTREGTGLSLAADVHRAEGYRQQFLQHSHVTQVVVMRLFQLLAVLSRVSATTPFAAPQLGPTRSTATVMDLHRELLTAFCRRVGLPPEDAERLLSSAPHGMAAVYEALTYYAVMPSVSHSVVAKVDRWLAEHIPALRPATRVVCALHAGREAEYVEGALLRLLGHTPTAMTWLCLRDATQPAERGRCFYSAVAQFSQTAVPAHVVSMELPVVDVGELDSCCEGWGLYNGAYKGHLLALPPWTWSRTVAAVMTGRPDAAAHLRDLLSLYSEWEASLAWTG